MLPLYLWLLAQICRCLNARVEHKIESNYCGRPLLRRYPNYGVEVHDGDGLFQSCLASTRRSNYPVDGRGHGLPWPCAVVAASCPNRVMPRRLPSKPRAVVAACCAAMAFPQAFAVPGQCPVSARSVPGHSARPAIAEDSARRWCSCK